MFWKLVISFKDNLKFQKLNSQNIITKKLPKFSKLIQYVFDLKTIKMKEFKVNKSITAGSHTL
jgi:hypothetical protein